MNNLYSRSAIAMCIAVSGACASPSQVKTLGPSPYNDLRGSLAYTVCLGFPGEPVPTCSFDIFVAEVDSIVAMGALKPTRLTHRKSTEETNATPAWSPNGKRIAFASERSGREDSDIYIMNADGSNQARITDDPAPESAPTWSPDGRKIAFRSSRDGNADIFVMDADGKNQRNLTRTQTYEGFPAWSPDGKWIAFLVNLSTYRYNCELHIMDPEGGNVRPVPIPPNKTCDYFPSWSPDSKRLAIVHNDGPYGKSEYAAPGTDISLLVDPRYDEIYTVGIDGSNFTNLTNDDPSNARPDDHPTWSPDGKWIAFVSGRTTPGMGPGGQHLCVMLLQSKHVWCKDGVYEDYIRDPVQNVYTDRLVESIHEQHAPVWQPRPQQ